MRRLLIAMCLLSTHAQAQMPDFIAPEGKILNYRTLTWDDFQGREDEGFAKDLASRNLQAAAYVCPAIYYKADSGDVNERGRVTFKIHMKCAFQSRAFVRESTKEHTGIYVLTHEQDHYDIALTYARKMCQDLANRDYDREKYNEEMDKITMDIYTKYQKVQETYDGEVNPEGRDDTAKQSLWDMRIKKAMDLNNVDMLNSPLSVVSSVKIPGQTVKSVAGETDVQFAVRVRPLYTEFPEEMAPWVKRTDVWNNASSMLAFYTQRYYQENESGKQEMKSRTIGCVFIPNGPDTYKRSLIDTFSNDGYPVKIAAVFYANVDSDDTKELIVIATSQQKGKDGNGTRYIIRAYDHIGKPYPARMKYLEAVAAQIAGGFEGSKDGKPSKALNKTEKDVMESLKKLKK